MSGETSQVVFGIGYLAFAVALFLMMDGAPVLMTLAIWCGFVAACVAVASKPTTGTCDPTDPHFWEETR